MHNFPYYLGFFVSGGFLAFPGAAFDKILLHFQFSPAEFGIALTVQGTCSFLGSFVLSKVLKKKSPSELLGISFLLLFLSGIALYGPPAFAELKGLQIVERSKFLLYAAYGFLGFSIGANSIVNNASGLGRGNETRNLNFLNVYFTLGALMLPAFTNAYFKFSSEFWTLPALLLAVVPMLSFVVRTLPLSKKAPLFDKKNIASENTSEALQTEMQSYSKSRFPFWAGCVILFCYVGTEINLSNHAGPLLVELGIDTASARLASTFFWAGLFGVRVFFCFFVPKKSQLTSCLLLLAASTVVSLFGLLAGARFFSVAVLFGLLAWIGASIGSFYSLGLSAMRVFYPLKKHENLVFQVAMAGTLGSILLPSLSGIAVQEFGEFTSHMLVVGISVLALFSACATLFAVGKREQG